MAHQSLFNEDEQAKIRLAIQDAESHTSGEIRVHVESKCSSKNVLDRAAEVFALLEMQKTHLRNGVLFYLAVNDHKFAILGDAGINQVVPGDFWDVIKVQMQKRFRAGNITEGLCEGIRLAGQQLTTHFPAQKDDINELPDHISFD